MEDNPYQPPESNLDDPIPPVQGLAPLPWENRERLGFVSALSETVILFFKDPVQAYARAKESGDYGSPLIYAIILGTIGGILGQIWSVLFNIGTLPFLGEDALPLLGIAGGMGIMMVILTPLMVLISLFIGSGLIHVSLLITGGLPNSRSGFEGTLRSQAYATSTNVLAIVPILGGMIAAIWSIVLNVIGLKRMHGISTGRALVGIFLPLVVLCCGAIMLMIVVAGGLVALNQ